MNGRYLRLCNQRNPYNNASPWKAASRDDRTKLSKQQLNQKGDDGDTDLMAAKWPPKPTPFLLIQKNTRKANTKKNIKLKK